MDCESEIWLRCHNRIGFSPYCSVDSNLVAIDATVTMHLLEPHPWPVGHVTPTLLEFRQRYVDCEVAVGSVGPHDANRAPVTERSIKEPHRGGDDDY
jgi:hypothetical protein